MKKLEKLEKFIIDNHLNFNGSDSGLNSMCTVVSGYALHIEASVDEVEKAVSITFPKADSYQEELKRVYKFAKSNGYETFWKNPEAKEMYKF